MAQARLARRPHHDLAVVALDPEARMAADIVAQVFQAILRVTLAEIDSEHTPPSAAAEGRVLGVVIKTDEIAGLRLQRDSRHVAPGEAPEILAAANLLLERVRVLIAGAMAAGDHAQAAGIAGKRIQIE